jgi:ABC-type branched-subunit amino acid transport system substrate-binding protein
VKWGQGGDPELDVNPPAPAGGNGGATDVGVTADTINIGQMVSNSGISAGIFDGVIESAQKYADLVNAGGGIYGRKIKIAVKDDSFDVTKDTTLCTPLVDSSFALVGSMALADTGCYSKMKSSGIPLVAGLSWDPNIAKLPNAYIPPPNEYSSLPPAIYKALNPDLKKVWLCMTGAPGTEAQGKAETAAWEAVGVQVVNQGTLPGNVADYTAAVLKAKNAGAQGIDCFSTQVQVTAAIAKAVVQQGWKPMFATGFSVYDPNFIKLAGDAANNGWAYAASVPYLDEGLIASTAGGQQYIKQVGHAPQTASDYFGWEFMNLAVQALVKAGPDLTRKSFLDALSGIHKFTAGGLVPAWDPGAKNEMSSCFALQVIKDGKFVQTVPEEGSILCGGDFFPKS